MKADWHHENENLTSLGCGTIQSNRHGRFLCLHMRVTKVLRLQQPIALKAMMVGSVVLMLFHLLEIYRNHIPLSQLNSFQVNVVTILACMLDLVV